ncbi:MAG TPA: 3-deoxy-8-phosphooctulonate synthase [Saprospiraceae bacterium]|nr:3-deoxy-8-phosphooctulonate synthase [Saprospiraceae bacterium]
MYQIPRLRNNDQRQFFLIAGPCVVESKDICFEIAERVKAITDRYAIPYIFKASYKKANRSKIDSFTGIGDEAALEIMAQVGQHFSLPTTTDVHTEEEARLASRFVDILQIPAFLCRQTELLVAAAKTNKVVNVKKGQFMSPEAMSHAVDKIRAVGNDQVILTDRGSCFGYHDLIVDFRGIPAMQRMNVPVVMDCTHSLQQPNQTSGVTGGRPQDIPIIAKAAIAVGADGLFIETHPDCKNAKSDGANMLPLDQLESLLDRLSKIRAAIIN